VSATITPTDDLATAKEAQSIAVAEGRAGASRWSLVLPPLLTFVLFIATWYFLSYVVVGGEEFKRVQVLPAPHEVLQDGFMPWWEDRTGIKPILEALWPTMMTALVGLFLAIVIGMFTAIVMNFSKSLERAIFPYAVIAQTVPILALVPILTQWFGFGFANRVLVTVLIAIFPVITNTYFGLQSADRAHHDLFTLNGVNRMTRLWKMELPNAQPAIFTGLRIAAGGAVIGAIVGDFFFTQGDRGIGWLIQNYAKRAARKPELIAATIMSSVFGILMFFVVGAISNRVLRNWHESAAKHT
jgi:NitT/TauT family transport system permease protein